jgi:hypothetical protein
MKSEKPKHIKINVPDKGNKLLHTAVEKVNTNEEIYTIWEIINVNAIDRLGMSDHGPVHFQIVANIALRLARILNKNGVKMSVVTDHNLSHDHAELIIFLASICHDLGMSIHRDDHEEFSLILTNRLLHEILNFLPIKEKTIIISETLHAVISHRKNGNPLTFEAGILRVADALDMSEGRSRIPYEKGEKDIYAISAAAINSIEIKEGVKFPIEILIKMNNSAGIFQIDELLKSKLKGSKIDKYIEVNARLEGKKEKLLIKNYSISG